MSSLHPVGDPDRFKTPMEIVDRKAMTTPSIDDLFELAQRFRREKFEELSKYQSHPNLEDLSVTDFLKWAKDSDVLSKLDVSQGGEWVAVSERLPENRPGYSNSLDVNIFRSDGAAEYVSTGSYSYHFNRWDDYLYSRRSEPVTHWMPLPQIPQP